MQSLDDEPDEATEDETDCCEALELEELEKDEKDSGLLLTLSLEDTPLLLSAEMLLDL